MAPAQILRNLPEIEVPPETPNGVITDFTVTKIYVPGTVSVWLNGMRLQADLETGFIEIPPQTVRMKEAPVLDDTIEVQYEAE